MRVRIIAMALILVTSIPMSAKRKERTWQTGKVLDMKENSVYAGQSNSGRATATTSGDTTTAYGNGESSPNYRIYETYVIEAPPYIYECSERIRWRWSKAALLTVNGPVQFAIEKNVIYIKSEDGSEHPAAIFKKTLRP